MSHSQKLFTLILAGSLFFCSCRQDNSPSSSYTSVSTGNYLYLFVSQGNQSCPLTLTVVGPTTYQDVVGSKSSLALVAFNYGVGNYTFYFDGATDGVVHSLSGAETISCSPTAGCGNWTYTVTP